jgi:hypothetical protein
VTTKKLIIDIFSIRPNCQPRVSRSSRHTQVMLQTVTLFYIHCGCCCIIFWAKTRPLAFYRHDLQQRRHRRRWGGKQKIQLHVWGGLHSGGQFMLYFFPIKLSVVVKALSNQMAPDHLFFWIARSSFKGIKKDQATITESSDGIFQISSRNLILILPHKTHSSQRAELSWLLFCQ